MCRISVSQFAQALRRQKSFTDAEWAKQCDELAVQQPILFFELLTFLQNGVPQDIGRRLIDYRIP
jgi:hypothetical protein